MDKILECNICKQKIEEIQNFDIRLYHVWREHKEIVMETDEGIAVNIDIDRYRHIFSEVSP